MNKDFPNFLSKPAQRALASIEITQLEDLTKLSEKELSKLHGLGPNALIKLREALSARGLSFRQDI
jgi:DNA repair protein RadC